MYSTFVPKSVNSPQFHFIIFFDKIHYEENIYGKTLFFINHLIPYALVFWCINLATHR